MSPYCLYKNDTNVSDPLERAFRAKIEQKKFMYESSSNRIKPKFRPKPHYNTYVFVILHLNR